MTIERDRPRPHLVIDDFFAEEELDVIFRELPTFQRKMKPGLVRDIGHDGQSVFFEHPRRKNKAVWIHDPSKTLRLFRERFWSEPMVELFEQAREPLFQIIPNCWAPHLQVSSYATGDSYDFHVDEGAGVNLTTVVFLAPDPSKVRGGHLVLAGYDGEETTIRFRHNRLLVFPSKTLHRVTPVRIEGGDETNARISLQCWLTYGRPPAKPKRRPPEADRPTFLLAEESILAAAQGISPSAVGTDLTPEDLYWGAFYVSRILTANLRCLIAELGDDFTVAGGAQSPVRIRRRHELEVFARGRLNKTSKAVRVGFELRGPPGPTSEALRLFVDRGRDEPALYALVPPAASESATRAILKRLLARATQAHARD